MRRMPLAAAALGALALGAGCAAYAAYAYGAFESRDRRFARAATQSGLAELAEARIALNQAADPEVRQFAQTMLADHGKANDELIAIGTRKGLDLPTSRSRRDRALADRLKAMSGAQFDRSYVKDQVVAHRRAVALFARESREGKDADLKRFATTTLPALEQHLAMVRTLAARV